MDPKRDKAHAIRKEAQELADMIDSQPQDNNPRKESKRSEDLTWRAHEECAGRTYEPERSYAGEPAKKQVSEPAASARNFREYCEEPTYERGGQPVWKKEREEDIVKALSEWERKQGDKEK